MSSPSTQSLFLSNVLTLISGTTIGLLITIVASPIITRLFGPESFGLAALFTSISGILIVIACFRYELAVVLPVSDEEAANVFGLCIIILVFFSVLSIPIFQMLEDPIVHFLNAPQLAKYLWMVPLALFTGGMFLVLNYWNTRTKHFHQVALARVAGSCSTTGAQLSIGLAGFTSGGVLIGAGVLGQMVSALILGVQIFKNNLSFFKKNISCKSMKDVFRRFSNFPKYDIWSALLNSISWQIPIFLLSYYFSTTIVGFYSLGMMIIQLPMSVIGSAIAQVFFQRATEAQKENSLHELVGNVFRILLLIVLFPMLTLAIIGADFFSVIFGSMWTEAGIYTQILSVWAVVWFISSPLSMIYIVLERQDFGLKINVANFFTRLASIIIGGMLGSPIIALMLFSISGIFVYGYLGLKMLDLSQVKKYDSLIEASKNLLAFLPAGILLIVMKFFTINSIIIVIFGISLCLVYYLFLIRTDRQIQILFYSITHSEKITGRDER